MLDQEHRLVSYKYFQIHRRVVSQNEMQELNTYKKITLNTVVIEFYTSLHQSSPHAGTTQGLIMACLHSQPAQMMPGIGKHIKIMAT